MSCPLDRVVDRFDYEMIVGVVRLYEAKEKGIKTWVSFEPVLDTHQILYFIENCNDIFDRMKIGKLNYHPSDINWPEFGRWAEALCQELGLDYTIKESLRREMEARA